MYCINRKRTYNGLSNIEQTLSSNKETYINLKEKIESNCYKIYLSKEISENKILNDITKFFLKLKKQCNNNNNNYQVIKDFNGNEIYINNNYDNDDEDTIIMNEIIQEMKINLNFLKQILLKEYVFNDYKIKINENKLIIKSDYDNFNKIIPIINIDDCKFNKFNKFDINYKFSDTNTLIAQIIIEIPYEQTIMNNEPEYVSCQTINYINDPTYQAIERIRLEYIQLFNQNDKTTKKMRCQ